MFNYRVGVGAMGVVLETYIVSAKNLCDARSIGIRNFLHPDKGFDYIEVKRIK